MLNSNYNKTKKAFGGVASTLIMFIAIIGVTTGMVMSFQNYFLQTKDTLNSQQKQTNEKLKTFITITHTYYDASSTNLRVYVKNTGSINVDTRFTDVFVGEGFMGNLTSYYAGTTNISKNLISAETMYIDYPVTLVPGSHNVRVVTRVGVGDNVDFNVQ
jgi:archaellum component FlaF (FlaF/FlaG flagellin family)